MKDGITAKQRMKWFGIKTKKVKRPTLREILQRKFSINFNKGE